MSYDSSGRRITAPVSIYDLQQALSSNSNDLGTLCQNTNIDKWARYKPIRHSSKGMVTEADRRQGGFNTTDRVMSKYGLAFSVQASQDIFLENLAKRAVMDNTFKDWEYLRPRGSSQNEPFRLTDFVKNPNDGNTGYNIQGYMYTGEPPFAIGMGNADSYQINRSSYVVKMAEVTSITFAAYLMPSTQIKLSEFLDTSQYGYSLVVELYTSDPFNPYSSSTPVRKYYGGIINDNTQESTAIITLSELSAYASSTVWFLAGLQQYDPNQTELNRGIAGTAFFAPKTSHQLVKGQESYYYKVLLSTEFTLRLAMIELGHGGSGTFTLYAGVYYSTSSISPYLWGHVTITRSTQKYYFAKSTTTIPSDGMRLGLYLTCPSLGINTPFELDPSNASRQTGVSYITIPTGTSNQTTDLYFYSNLENGSSNPTTVSGLLNNGQVHIVSMYCNDANNNQHFFDDFGIKQGRVPT